jgi:hypothetical protein
MNNLISGDAFSIVAALKPNAVPISAAKKEQIGFKTWGNRNLAVLTPSSPLQSDILNTPTPWIFPCFNRSRTLFASTSLDSWTSGVMGILKKVM